MSALLERVLLASDKAIADPKWVERGLASVRRETAVFGPFAAAGAAGLDYLDAHRESVSAISAGTFLDVTRHLAVGRDELAESVFLDWLESKATPEERTAARLSAAREVVLEEDAAVECWAETKSLVMGFLKVAVQAALPILLQVVAGAL